METIEKHSGTFAPERAIQTLLTPIFTSLESNVTDLVINPNSRTFKYYTTGDCIEIQPPISASEIRSLAFLLGGDNKEDISDISPSVSSRVLLNSRAARLEIVLPPAVEKPCLSLRFYVLSNTNTNELYEKGMLTNSEKDYLIECVRTKKNIVISGATGSGKTTLLSALINEIDIKERVIIIEDLPEIECILPNYTRIITNINTGFDGSSAIIRTLRMRPDRIIYGEVRTSAAFDLLDSWQTGHSGGLGTIHASSTREALDRLSKLASRKSQNISFETCKHITNTTVDVVVQLGFKNSKRCILDIYKKQNGEPI